MRATNQLRAALSSEVARGATGTVVLNAVALVLGFVLLLVLSRQLGPSGFGAYSFAFAWASLLSVPAVLGLSPVLVRNVATYNARERWAELRGIFRRANQAVLAMSLVLAGVAAIAGALMEFSEPSLRQPFLIGLVLVPLLALSAVRLATLQGFGHVVLARLPETLVAPAMFLALVALVAAVGSSFSASWAVGLQVVATLLAFVVGAALVRARMPRPAGAVTPAFETRTWARSAAPLLLVSVLGAIGLQAGTIALGLTADAAEVGVYAVAVRIAVLTGFLSVAAMYPLMPAVARLHATGDHERLTILVRRSAQVVLLLSLPLALAFVALPGFFLGVFGAGYSQGETVLRVLVLGELLKLALGNAGIALAMSGLEGQVLKGVTAGAVTNLVLLGALVPPLAAEGAAIALAAGALVTNGVLAYLAWSRLGLYTPVLRVPRLAR